MATSRQRTVLAAYDSSFSVGQRAASALLSRLPVGFSASDALFATSGVSSATPVPTWLAETLLATTIMLNDIPVLVADAESEESLRAARDQLAKARQRSGKSGFSLIIFIDSDSSGSSCEEAIERLSRVVREHLREGGVAVASFSHRVSLPASKPPSAAREGIGTSRALVSQVMTRITESVPSCRLIRPSSLIETLLPYPTSTLLTLTR